MLRKLAILFTIVIGSLGISLAGSEPVSVPLSLVDESGQITNLSQVEGYVILAVDSAVDSTTGTFYTMPFAMGDYGATKLVIDCYRIQERDSGNVFDQVVGSGDFDLTSGGTYTGSQDTTMYIKIAAVGTPDSICYIIGDTTDWSGADSTVIDSATAMDLGLGKTFTFFDDDNHTANDVFKLICYADGYTGYTWKDTVGDSIGITVQPQTYDLSDNVANVATAQVLTDTGVVSFWLGKGDSFLGSDSVGAYVRVAITITDSLGSAAIDTANVEYKYWFNIIAQKKK